MKRIIISHCDWITPEEALQIASRVPPLKSRNAIVLVEGGCIPEGFKVVLHQSRTPAGALKIHMYQKSK